MIYLLHGTDIERSREKLRSLMASLVAKKPDASRIKFTDETFNSAEFPGLVGGQGLFSNKLIVEFDRVFEKKNHEIF